MRWIPLLAALFLLALGAVSRADVAETRPVTQTRQFTFYVREGTVAMPDGTQIYVWGFTDDPSGPAKIPGPAIEVNEGDNVEITLVNDRDPTASERQPLGEGHTIHLHGLDVPMEHDGVPETHREGLVLQGGTFTYRFTAAHAGTYFYHCHQNNVEHQQMGMYGPIIVHAANGANTAYTGGPAFDREYTLTLSEMGAEGHAQAQRAVKEGAEPYNWLQYVPTYYLVNGNAAPGALDTTTSLEARPGERILVRAINAGYVAHAIHTHGQSFQVVATDGRPWSTGPRTDTLWLGPGEKYDLLFVGNQSGAIALHNHVDERYAGAPELATDASPAAVDSDVVRRYTLYVGEGWQTMPDGARIYVYGYTDQPDGAARVPGPVLTANAGDLVEVTLVNDQDPTGDGHGFAITGWTTPLDGPARVAPGETATYRFRASQAGSYFYVDQSEEAHQRMGMYGALVVASPSGASTVYSGGPNFDQQYTMVLSELDAPAHEQMRQAVQEGAPKPTLSKYNPNYFLINGLAYPDTEQDAASMVTALPGERILIRAINAGQVPHAMHLHGYHFDVVSSGAHVLRGAPSKDTVLIAPGESYDLLFVADQAGIFPFHDHFETANTNNGVWLGGMHTMVATGVTHDQHAVAAAAPPAADGPTVFVRDNFYTPNQITVPVGTTVQWVHQGRVEHTVSSLLGYFDSGTLRGGDIFSYTFTAPGRYDYYCRFHLTNRGAVLIE